MRTLSANGSIKRPKSVSHCMPPGEDAVKIVAQHGQREGDGGHRGAPSHATLARGNEDGSEREAQDGELVGEGHSGKGKMANAA